MKYAVIKLGGSQYRVAEGDILGVAKLEGEKGKKISLSDVLLYVDGEVKIGQPLVEGAKVQAEIIEQAKGEKVRVATYKAKSRHRRVKGFRPKITNIKITSIVLAKKQS